MLGADSPVLLLWGHQHFLSASNRILMLLQVSQINSLVLQGEHWGNYILVSHWDRHCLCLFREEIFTT